MLWEAAAAALNYAEAVATALLPTLLLLPYQNHLKETRKQHIRIKKWKKKKTLSDEIQCDKSKEKQKKVLLDKQLFGE